MLLPPTSVRHEAELPSPSATPTCFLLHSQEENTSIHSTKPHGKASVILQMLQVRNQSADTQAKPSFHNFHLRIWDALLSSQIPSPLHNLEIKPLDETEEGRIHGGWVNVCVLQGKYKMSPEELVVPESREVLEEWGARIKGHGRLKKRLLAKYEN